MKYSNSLDTPGLKLWQHEDLHIADWRAAFGPDIDSQYKFEGVAGFNVWFLQRISWTKAYTHRWDRHP